MDEPNPPIAEIAVATLCETIPGLLAVYRFGSAGSVYQRDQSDIDLAFLADQPLADTHRWQLAQDLAALLGRDVDLVDLRRSSTVMQMQVVARGERVYCADRQAVDLFEDLVFGFYARLNEERRAILEDVRRRGRIYA